jgi:hypothetical protein
MFVLKDLKTGEARQVKWSSVKDSLDLFCNKSFDSVESRLHAGPCEGGE